MKTRSGFVSNSSSTAFIIHITDTNRHLFEKEYIVEETEHIWSGSRYCESESSLIARGFEQIEEYPYGNDETCKVYARKAKLRTAKDLGRETSMALGTNLMAYWGVMYVEEYTQEYATILMDAIEKYGLENVAFIRSSDEGMGGYLPAELCEVCRGPDVIAEFEYH